MQTQVYKQWVEDTRKFWDTDSDFDARYRRICSDPEIDSCTDKRHLEDLWDKRTTEELAQLLRGIPLQSEWTCLEIGCGLGRLLKPIAERCKQAIGVDVSEKMVGHAVDYLDDTPNAEIHLNDGMTLDIIEDESIDWVFSHLAFQHMTLPGVVESYLSEITRVLRPSGYCRIQCWREARIPFAQRAKNIARAVLNMPRFHGPRRWLWAPGKEVRFGGITFHPNTWRKLQEKHGLKVVEMQQGLGHDYWMWTTSRKA